MADDSRWGRGLVLCGARHSLLSSSIDTGWPKSQAGCRIRLRRMGHMRAALCGPAISLVLLTAGCASQTPTSPTAISLVARDQATRASSDELGLQSTIATPSRTITPPSGWNASLLIPINGLPAGQVIGLTGQRDPSRTTSCDEISFLFGSFANAGYKGDSHPFIYFNHAAGPGDKFVIFSQVSVPPCSDAAGGQYWLYRAYHPHHPNDPWGP